MSRLRVPAPFQPLNGAKPEFLNFRMNRERQKVEFDAPKSFCLVFF